MQKQENVRELGRQGLIAEHLCLSRTAEGDTPVPPREEYGRFRKKMPRQSALKARCCVSHGQKFRHAICYKQGPLSPALLVGVAFLLRDA